MFNKDRIKNLVKSVKNIKIENEIVEDEEERAIINVGAENFDDIFSSYCFRGGDTLSFDLVDYLEEKAATIPFSYDLSLRFHVKGATEEKRKEIEDAVKNNYINDVHAVEERMKRNGWFSFTIIMIGLLLFAIYVLDYMYASPSFAIKTLLDFGSCLFLWEGLDIFLLDRRILQLERLKKYRLLEAKIVIVEFEPY